MTWLDKTLEAQSLDQDIIWKATSQHYPLFGMHYTDTESIVTQLMPLLKEHEYDVYFNGHEHMMNYAHAPDSIFTEPIIESEIISAYQRFRNIFINKDKDNCFKNFEFFPNFNKEA